MADIKSPEARSHNMSRIRSKDTKPEVWLRKKLFAKGYRYRKNVSKLPGHPDLWMAKYNTVVFIHGCFWHRHKNCKYAYTPKSRVEFWNDKFQKNMKRDAVVMEQLQSKHINVIVIWECTVKRMMKSEELCDSIISSIQTFLNNDMSHLEL